MLTQPTHTVYGGAHLFRHNVTAKLGRIALDTLHLYSDLIAVSDSVITRVEAKLKREPVEDLRIDFEDGYGIRGDEEEDRHAAAAAGEVASGLEAGTLPAYTGIRIKPLSG